MSIQKTDSTKKVTDLLRDNGIGCELYSDIAAVNACRRLSVDVGIPTRPETLEDFEEIFRKLM